MFFRRSRQNNQVSYGLKDHYLRKQSFDIGLVEQYDFCGFGLFQALNITKIFWLSAIGVYSGQAAVFGVDYPLSYMPELLADLDDQMTFLNRVENTLTATVLSVAHKFVFNLELLLYRKHLQSGINPSQLLGNVQFIVANALPIIDFVAPTNDRIVYVARSAEIKKASYMQATLKFRNEFCRNGLASYSALHMDLFWYLLAR
ncbi:unnamed protein product [Enterobius vermicularis]|uniref:glucuronosyltransferase n=1 Tax=Enterobius vermicularis TaxID=51028 RepID=A0A0N4VBE5_ENTVE|nr:unnamed protein product [Enterobius vermicularis]